MKAINLKDKYDKFHALWTPKIIGEFNGQYIKLAKVKGDFIWHSHEAEDELFMVQKGKLYIEFRDRTQCIGSGEMIIVPKGVEHRPYTKGEEVQLVLIEPIATKHTGDVDHELTVRELEWV